MWRDPRPGIDTLSHCEVEKIDPKTDEVVYSYRVDNLADAESLERYLSVLGFKTHLREVYVPPADDEDRMEDFGFAEDEQL